MKWGSTGSGGGEFNNPVGIAVDPLDNVYVADQGNSQIQVFSKANYFKGSSSIAADMTSGTGSGLGNMTSGTGSGLGNMTSGTGSGLGNMTSGTGSGLGNMTSDTEVFRQAVNQTFNPSGGQI